MNAYNGGKMKVDYYGDVVVDLQGMTIRDTTPIYYGHGGAYSIDAILGQSEKVAVEDGKLNAAGTIMGSGDIVEKVTHLAVNGFRFQASIGATPIKSRYIEEGEQVEANGQTFDGPLYFVSQSTLDEISIVPLGADKSTETLIAAQTANTNQENTMADITKTAESIRAEAVAEENRLASVRIEAKDHPEIAVKAIKDGWTVEATKMAVKDAIIAAQKAEIEAAKIQAERPMIPFGIIGDKSEGINAKAIEASVCVSLGLRNPEKSGIAAADLDKGSGLKIRSLTELVRACMAIEGKRLDVSRHDTRDFIAAAFSTKSIANVLSNVANKFIMEGYGQVEESWRKVASIRSVVDFKANTGVRLILANLLKSISPAGEIQHGQLSDETRSIQADTKGLMLGISRKDIVNDDLGVLTELPRKLGFAAARTFNTDFWAALVAAVAAKFPSDASLGNYTTGALSLSTLKTTEALFMALQDADGNPIGMGASMLLVSPTNSAAARELYTATNAVGGSTKEANANIFTGKYEPVVSSYLSGAPYWLVGSPLGMPLMEAAFLNGRQEPFVETADADFNTLGVQMRCYYDYGVAFAENRGAVYSTGA